MFIIGIISGLLIGALGIGWTAYALRSNNNANTSFLELKSQIRDLDRALQALQQLSTDYFNSIKPVCFDRLRHILAGLMEIEELCESLARNGASRDASALVFFVSREGGSGRVPTVLRERASHLEEDLRNWKKVVQDTLSEIVDRVNDASRAFQNVGLKRVARRAPTSVILGELRQAIELSTKVKTGEYVIPSPLSKG